MFDSISDARDSVQASQQKLEGKRRLGMTGRRHGYVPIPQRNITNLQ